MRIDQDYLRNLLVACQESKKPTFDIEDLQVKGFSYDDPKFEFHMKLLDDQRFIAQDDGDHGFGLIKGLDGFASWAVVPLRLTASGHQFIEALSNDEVWTVIKRDFKEASIDTLKKVAVKLLDGFVSKKMKELLG